MSYASIHTPETRDMSRQVSIMTSRLGEMRREKLPESRIKLYEKRRDALRKVMHAKMWQIRFNKLYPSKRSLYQSPQRYAQMLAEKKAKRAAWLREAVE